MRRMSGSSSTIRTLATCSANHADGAVAWHDLADVDRLVPAGPQDVEGPEGVALRDDRDHADAEVEDLGHLGVGDLTQPLDLAEDRRRLPCLARHDGVAVA